MRWAGEEVEAVVLKVDPKAQRILRLLQAEADALGLRIDFQHYGFDFFAGFEHFLRVIDALLP